LFRRLIDFYMVIFGTKKLRSHQIKRNLKLNSMIWLMVIF